MKKILLTIAFFAALGAANAQPYPRGDVRRFDEHGVYRDHRGQYHWQVVERRVWIPTQRVGNGVFGRVIPGHYEIRRDRVKVYLQRDRHPHGMPPGQRKKHYRDNDRGWDDRRWDNDRRDDKRWNNDDKRHNNRRYDRD